MRREQLVFLLGGLLLGVLLGAAGTAVALRPELVGVTPPPAAGAGTAAADPMSGVQARLADLNQRIEQDPADARALVERADILMQGRMVQRALQDYQAAAEAAPADADILLRAATAYSQIGALERALEYARRAVAADPSRPAAAEAAFELALRTGDLEAAAELLAGLRERTDSRPGLDQLEQRLGRAREIVEAASERPDDYDAQLAAGNYYYDVGRWAESEEHYRRAIALREANPDILTDLGTVVARQGRPEEAFSIFEQALQIEPDHWEAALNSVVIALETRQPERAREWLSRLEALRPDHPSLRQFRAQVAHMEAGVEVDEERTR